MHGPGYSSDKCKVLGDFDTKYAKVSPSKYHRQEPATNMNFGRNQENNDTVQHEVDEIILQDNKNLSVKDETHESIDYEFNEYELYELGKIILD